MLKMMIQNLALKSKNNNSKSEKRIKYILRTIVWIKLLSLILVRPVVYEDFC